MRKSIIRVIAAALLAAASGMLASCSHFNSEVTLRDLGFEVRGEIVWNADYMAYTLRLGLERGEDGQYALSYLIDGDPLVSLRTTGGGTLSSGETVELSTRESLVCILPTLSPGEQHSLRMEFTRRGSRGSSRSSSRTRPRRASASASTRTPGSISRGSS